MLQRAHFLNAVILSCQAVIEYAERYAELASQMAAECTDPVRKAGTSADFSRTAAVCRQTELPASMRHASLSGLYSSCFRLNPADILFHLDVLISICILIIKQILTKA